MPARGNEAMAANKTVEGLAVGTIVTIRNSGYGKCKIVEYRGPLGPGGVRIYRVRVRRKPKPAYVELREDQLEPVVTSS
jgi:hypothetical protein